MESNLCTAFKKIEHQNKWLVSQFTFGDKLDALYSDLTSGEARAVSDGSYRSEVVMISPVCTIESNYGT